MILLLSLEAAGHVFLRGERHLLRASRSSAHNQVLLRHHIEIEKDHEMFEQRMKDFLGEIALSAEELRLAFAMVERIHAAFITMFDGLLSVLDRMSQRPPAQSEAPAV